MSIDRTNKMPTVDAERFWLEGYTILRSVFTPEEVLAWREAAYRTSNDDWVKLRPDLLSKHDFRCLILDERILSIANQILGETPIYFGESACGIGDTDAGFHKDNTGQGRSERPGLADTSISGHSHGHLLSGSSAPLGWP